MPDCSARTREFYLLESQEPRESIGPAFHSKNVFHVEHRRMRISIGDSFPGIFVGTKMFHVERSPANGARKIRIRRIKRGLGARLGFAIKELESAPASAAEEPLLLLRPERIRSTEPPGHSALTVSAQSAESARIFRRLAM
jgi:hypothetical protein